MTDNNLSHVGDQDELENCCQNVLELDLSKNEFMDWNEVFIYLVKKTLTKKVQAN